jgi:hypothetical protein
MERLLPTIAEGILHGEIALEVYLSITFGPGRSAPKTDREELTGSQREALDRLLPAIAAWDLSRRWPSKLGELEYHGLPDTPAALAAWLGRDLPPPVPTSIPTTRWKWWKRGT